MVVVFAAHTANLIQRPIRFFPFFIYNVKYKRSLSGCNQVLRERSSTYLFMSRSAILGFAQLESYACAREGDMAKVKDGSCLVKLAGRQVALA